MRISQRTTFALVDHQRQVAPRLYPPRHRRPDHCLRRGPNDERFFQLGRRIGDQATFAVRNQAVVRDDRHFLGKTIDMVGLFLKE